MNSFNHAETPFTLDWSSTVYLSPDANEVLQDFDEHTSFIVGGLIDRSVVRNATLSQATLLNI